jgi:hypothetical protein
MALFRQRIISSNRIQLGRSVGKAFAAQQRELVPCEGATLKRWPIQSWLAFPGKHLSKYQTVKIRNTRIIHIFCKLRKNCYVLRLGRPNLAVFSSKSIGFLGFDDMSGRHWLGDWARMRMSFWLSNLLTPQIGYRIDDKRHVSELH